VDADEMFSQRPGAAGTEQEEAADAAARAARAETLLWLRGQWSKAAEVAGSPAEKYLVEHRGLVGIQWPSSLRYAPHYQTRQERAPHPCLLGAVTNPAGELVALHSIEISPLTGTKSKRIDQPKRSRGPVADGAIFLGDPKETPPVLVVGEGLETVLTRRLVGPADLHACCGGVRWIEPKPHHHRVEIIADTNSVTNARKLAREYARTGRAAHVVTVADSLGPKGDLNDALRQFGLPAVQRAIEDAEIVAPAGDRPVRIRLRIGSDVEIGQRCLEELEDIYGMLVHADGALWRFDRTHFSPLDSAGLARFVHRVDGATYPGSKTPGVVRLNESRIRSIINAMQKYRHDPVFFTNAPRGINCQSGFIQIDQQGNATLHPHGRQWRQRHLTNGRWSPDADIKTQLKGSHLLKYLSDAASPSAENYETAKADGKLEQLDLDAALKTRLLGEIAGCVALGYGTRLRQPKAVVLYSEAANTGKSRFLILVCALPNPQVVSHVSPSVFGDRSFNCRLAGKVVNTSDELTERAVRSEIFKKLITGEPISTRDLYDHEFDFVPIAQHIFSTNKLPRFTGGVDGGVRRRLLPVPFDHVVPNAEIDTGLIERILQDEPDLLLAFAVDGACRLIRQQDYTIPPSCKELLQNWLVEADPVHGWAKERLEIIDGENLLMVAELYDDFKSWAEASGIDRRFLPNTAIFGKRLRGINAKLRFDTTMGSARCRNAKLRTTA